METLNLIDWLDAEELPLKNRVNGSGYYLPPEENQGEVEAVPRAGRPSQPRALIPEDPLEDGEQYRFHFDMSKCIGCQCCVVACNEQNNNPSGVQWRRVGEIEGGSYPDTKKHHLSMACNHCLDPACLTGCPTKAYVKLDNGIVNQKAEECIGCQYCTWNCPYGVPQYNPERHIVTKCDMCHSRLSQGQVPACVAACPEGAIQIEKVKVQEWKEDHGEADGPGIPESGITISTTRITLPKDLPDETVRADRHRVVPEHPHASLIFLTVLTQLAAGGFLTLWLTHQLARYSPFLRSIQSFYPYGVRGMFFVAALALGAAIFHLGRPLYAYKALRGWKRSWLSREVLFFALFSKMGIAYAVIQWAAGRWNFSIPAPLDFALGLAVSLLGMAGVYASAKIYRVPARPAWDTVRTPLRFFLTGLILGPAFALGVFSVYVWNRHPAATVEPVFFAASALFLAVAASAGFLQLLVLLSRLFYLREREPDELYGSTYLLTHRFQRHFLARMAFLMAGCLVIPFFLYHLFFIQRLNTGTLVILSSAGFLASLAGEFLGRYLFFVTVVPKSMPGSFFKTRGGSS